MIRPPPIASPCNESFARMRGDDTTRFCDTCGKNVHDLSARSEAEARALLAAQRGARICVRYARDSSGAIRFRAATLAAAVSLAACSPHAPNPPNAPHAAAAPEEEHDMGDVVPDMGDVCPNDPEDRDGRNDTDGCPEPDAGASTDAAAPKKN